MLALDLSRQPNASVLSGQPLAQRIRGQDSLCQCSASVLHKYLQSFLEWNEWGLVGCLGFSSCFAMAAPQSAQEALRAWLNLLSPEERRVAESRMGATLPASAAASEEPTNVDTHAEPTAPHSQADPSTTPIPEEPNPTYLAQQEWYDSQDKIFQGPSHQTHPGRTMICQPSLHRQPLLSLWQARKGLASSPDAEAWLLPKPDTCLFNIFGEPFQLQDIKEKIAKGQMPHCLYKDPKAVDEQPLNRQEMWAAMQYKPIYRGNHEEACIPLGSVGVVFRGPKAAPGKG